MPPRLTLSVALTSVLIAVASCRGGESVLDPGESPQAPKPEWNVENCPDGLAGQHLHIAFVPAAGRIEMGDTLTLGVSAQTTSYRTARCRVFLKIEVNLSFVDSTSVVATRLGTTRVTALLPEDSVTATFDVVPASPIVPRRYRVIDLTSAVGNDSAVFGRMSQRREIVGNVSGRAFIWRSDGVEYLEGCAWAFDINVRGEVPCLLNPGAGIWRDGSITAIPELSSAKQLPPLLSMAINDSGVVAGSGSTVCAGCGLFLFRDGKFASIASVLPPSSFQFAVQRVNNAGQIFVSNRVDEYIGVIYIVRDGQLLDRAYIGTGHFNDANDHGVIVGSVQARGEAAYALLGLVDHSSQERLGMGLATSVNNATQVVGTLSPHPAYGEDAAQIDYSLRGAFLWDRASGITRLRWSAIDPSWVITEALQILDDGTILGKADNIALGRMGRTVLLVPES